MFVSSSLDRRVFVWTIDVELVEKSEFEVKSSDLAARMKMKLSLTKKYALEGWVGSTASFVLMNLYVLITSRYIVGNNYAIRSFTFTDRHGLLIAAGFDHTVSLALTYSDILKCLKLHASYPLPFPFFVFLFLLVLLRWIPIATLSIPQIYVWDPWTKVLEMRLVGHVQSIVQVAALTSLLCIDNY